MFNASFSVLIRVPIWLGLIFTCFNTGGGNVLAQATSTVDSESGSYAGDWETTFGLLTLEQKNSNVEGIYVFNGVECNLRGKVDGKKLRFTYQEPNAKGKGWFKLSADGNSFSGKWREDGNQFWQTWTGKRPRQLRGFSGLWKASYGLMRLCQEGDEVQGCYSFAGISQISGTVRGKRLNFTYKQPDGEKGSGWFELADDNQKFTGKWRREIDNEEEESQEGDWDGSRVRTIPGRIWLVILEANWENDLSETEYSYGGMLKEFFRQSPQVAIRHRYFQDEADLRRWCGDIRFLGGPVVVYISSHGTKEGITVGAETIGADVLADCLRNSGDIQLLHFGACSVMNGDIPKQLQARLGRNASFPISGFTKSADWMGSAIVDFTYLDLILNRNLDPYDAERQVREMITFAREHGQDSDAIPSVGLRLIQPSNAGLDNE